VTTYDYDTATSIMSQMSNSGNELYLEIRSAASSTSNETDEFKHLTIAIHIAEIDVL
jgi:hypothetical protein